MHMIGLDNEVCLDVDFEPVDVQDVVMQMKNMMHESRLEDVYVDFRGKGREEICFFFNDESKLARVLTDVKNSVRHKKDSIDAVDEFLKEFEDRVGEVRGNKIHATDDYYGKIKGYGYDY